MIERLLFEMWLAELNRIYSDCLKCVLLENSLYLYKEFIYADIANLVDIAKTFKA